MTEKLSILAWVGEDELGSGEVGIKRIIENGRYTALCLVEGQGDARAKLSDPDLLSGLQQMVNHYGKPVMLMKFEAVAPLILIEPDNA